MERARALEKLAEMYWRQGKLPVAQPLLERALAIHEELSGPESIETAVAITKLACIYSEQGKDADSLLLCGHSLAIADNIVDKLATAMHPPLPEARVLRPVKLAIPEEKEGALEHRRIRKGLRVLSQLYSDQATRFLRDRKFEAAHPLLQRALVMVEALPDGQDDELVAGIMSKLAWLLRRTGRLEEATALASRALRHSQDASVGGSNVETAVCYANLGVLQREQGNTKEAIELYQHAAHMHKQLHTGVTPEMAAMLQNQVHSVHESLLDKHVAVNRHWRKANLAIPTWHSN